jgi:filamentous hemagglutinin family protein
LESEKIMHRHAAMNRIYRLIWNRSLGSWVTASEHARGRGKGSGRSLVSAALSVSLSVAGAVTGAVAAAVADAWTGAVTGAATGPVTGTTTGSVTGALTGALTAALTGVLGVGLAQAGPQGGQVTAGAGSIAQSGATTTVTQSSQSLSLNWRSFNVGAGETVDFVQPGAAAVAINRILGNSASQIYGHIDAHGLVYLINPNGVVFGPGAQVNVGGLVASTLDLTGGAGTTGQGSGLSSTQSFSGTGTGSVINQGTITAATGGTVALLGNKVVNQGTISAQLGTVALGAGSAVTLNFNGNKLVSLRVDQSVLDTLAANGGLIQADGGRVLMSAGARDALLASAVNNTGIIEARTVQNQAGTITLLGGMEQGTANVGGTLDAGAPTGGDGGAIETSAAQVQVASTARVSTAAAAGLSGTWLIDPTDFTIAAGSGSQSTSGIGASTLHTALASGNVSIVTSNAGTQSGDINVNAALAWSANKLTLTAANDINVNAVMTVSGTAKVDFEPGSGNLLMGFAPDGSFTGRVDISSSAANALTIGGQIYTVINTLGAENSTTGTDLQGINGNLAGHFALGSNVDATATGTWSPCNGCGFGGTNGYIGFAPIGNSSSANFTGIFDGLGHTINNLTINNGFVSNVGIFGWIGAAGVARNIGVVGAGLYANTNVGALAGTNYGKISNTYVATGSGTVSAGGNGGGLVGFAGASSVISNSHVTGNVDSEYVAGGLVGENYGSISKSYVTATVGSGSLTGGLVGLNYGAITSSHATGNVQGGNGSSLGGLVGANASNIFATGSISDSYATGTVTGTQENSVGGLVGTNAGAISASYARGAVSVTGGNYRGIDTGGLVGSNSGSISTSYATGAVSAAGANQKDTGGLVGYNNGPISQSYATTGVVTGNIDVGGLVGYSYYGGSVSQSYAGGSVSGSLYVGGLVGRSFASVTTSHATGHVTSAGNFAGGLVGKSDSESSITDSYATGAVSGSDYTGGLAGMSYGTLSNSHASGAVTGADDTGGLVGMNPSGGTITTSYATGTVSGVGNIGGLVGNNLGAVSIAFASGAVTGTTNVGGLVGSNSGVSSSTITNSYATGSVGGSSYVGGLVGVSFGLVDKAYASGSVTGGGYAASLVGQSNGTITNSFYDGSVNPGMPGFFTAVGPGVNAPGALAGLTTAQLHAQANLTSPTAANASVDPAWDFAATWVMYEGRTAPLLQVFMTPLAVSGTVTQTYTGAGFAPSIGNLGYSLTPDLSHLFGTVTVTGSAVGARHAGTYSFTPGGLYSDQLGYIISYTGGSLTIDPATLTVRGTSVGSKTYNGSTTATLTGGRLVGLLGGDTLTLTQAGTFATAGPGSGIAVTAADTIGGPAAGDYLLVQPTGLKGTILAALPAANASGGAGPDPFLSGVITQLQGNLYTPPAQGSQPGALSAQPTLVVVQSGTTAVGAEAGVDTSAGGTDSVITLSGGKAIAVNVSMKIGAVGTLQIQNGGMLLPDDLVQISP